MRASLEHVVFEADAAGRAAGAFTCYDATTAAAALAAAEEAGHAVVLLVSPACIARPQGRSLVRTLAALADAASVPVCVQLDHARDLATILTALEWGVSGVLADGSRLPFADNVAFVEHVSAHARQQLEGNLEVELGHVAGDEDLAAAAARGALTDPEQAGRFVTATRATCLAVSIGNAHGRYQTPPALDWGRLAAIRAGVDVPLALHGASGLSDDDVRNSIGGGIRKVNVNTEIREAQLARVVAASGDLSASADVLGLVDVIFEEAHQVVTRKLALLDAATRASA